MKKYIAFLLLAPLTVWAVTNTYKQPNAAIFYKTLTLPALGSSGVVVNNASGLLSSVAPGTNGNVLTSNGTSWVSQAGGGGASIPLNTKGDLLGYSSSSVRVPVGATTGYVLTINPGATTGWDWEAAAGGFASPMTTFGDLIYENSTPAPARLGIGTTNNSLIVSGGAPAWGPIPLSSSNAVSSQLPLSNGGTSINAGSTTALFSALSPTTTAGDLLYEAASATGVTRLGVGSNTNLLTVSGGLPAWEAIPTWNQNTSGTCSNITGIAALINGGTGVAAGSSTAALNAISPMSTTGDLLYEINPATGASRLGIGSSSSVLTVNNGVPQWNPVTLSSANAITGQLPLANGGTSINAGSTTALFTGLSPTTTAGDLLYEAASATGVTRLGIGSTNNSLLVSSGLPAWGAVPLASSGAVSGILPLANGGTNVNAGSSTAAFNGLSPLSTTGDLLYEINPATGAARLGIGSSASVLTVNGGEPQWNPVTLSSANAVTGQLALANGGTGINAGSTTALFTKLSPTTTAGDMLYENATASALTNLAIGSSGSVLSVSNGIPKWIANSGAGNPTYAQAYFGGSAVWSTASATMTDPTFSGTSGFTVRASNNLTVTAGGSSVPGITFTPANSSAVYYISATFGVYEGGAQGYAESQLVDGSGTIINQAGQWAQEITTANAYGSQTLSGIYAPATSSAVTVKLQLAAPNTNTAYIESAESSILNAIEFTVIQINPPAVNLATGVTGILPAVNGGTSVATLGSGGSVLTWVGASPAWGIVNAAHYHGSTSTIGTNLTLTTYSTKDFDTSLTTGGTAYSSGAYTCPVTGVYQVNAGLLVTATTVATGTSVGMAIYNNGLISTYNTYWPYTAATSKPASLTISDMIQCTAGNTICIQAQSNGTTPVITNHPNSDYFSVSLVH